MTEKKHGRRVLLAVAVAAGALLLGILLAQFLPANLLGLRHDNTSHGTPGEVTGTTPGEVTGTPGEVTGTSTDGQLWTCGMHPQVIQDEPGQCPICGMNLTPMSGSGEDHAGHEHTPEGEREVLFYRNPMDPSITSPVPMQDNMGMDYAPVYADEADGTGDAAVVRIDPTVVQNMNVRTETVERRDLTRPIRTVGYLEFDPQRMVTVTTKYSGWIEKVYVNYVGEKVRRGQPLFEIYSPELVQTQQELLSALQFSEEMSEAPEDARERAQSLVESARARLGFWDVSNRQVATLESTGKVFRTLPVAAPASGVVMMRMAGLEGMAVKPGMELFHIADLSSLWLSAELFEQQLAWVQEGTDAEISLTYFPGETFHGTVKYLEPELSETSRTVRAMIEVANREGRLRKGMYATVDLQPVSLRDVVAVPSEAVLRTGRRNVVVVALGEGRFVPREVTLGQEIDGFTEIQSGIEAGDEVVTSAQFLLDSESTLRSAIQKMVAARRSGSGGGG